MRHPNKDLLDEPIDHRPKYWLLAGLVFLVAYLAYWLGITLGSHDFFGQVVYSHNVWPDTIYVDRIKTDTVIKVVRTERYTPKIVRIYLPDTVRRKRLESDTIITGLSLKPGKLIIETITPRGISLDQEFNLPPPQYLSLRIDAVGGLAVAVDSSLIRRDKRIARWRKVGNGALMVSAAIAGYLFAGLISK